MTGQIPHYQGHQDVFSSGWNTSEANTGLLFNRFFNLYDDQWQIEDKNEGAQKESAKVTFLKQLLDSRKKSSGQPVAGHTEQLTRYCNHQRHLTEQLGGLCVSYKSEWNWVTGMGYAHPIENGLTWHHTLAVPYFPGSSVKGLVRAWMETQDKPDRKKIHYWFGSDEKEPDKRVKEITQGALIFFDAIPEHPVNLVLDVMTPHSGDWLPEGKLQNAPGDWINPVPIPFLSCASAQLIFSVAPVPGAQNVDMDEVHLALRQALDFLGLGAKTSNGYGYFTQAE